MILGGGGGIPPFPGFCMKPCCHIYRRSWSTPREHVWYVRLKETSIKYSAIIALHKHIQVRTTLLYTTPVYLLPVLGHPSLCWNENLAHGLAW